MELFVNNTWTEGYEDLYVAEAIACSENGNHATIYATGTTAEEADTKLIDALRELGLVPAEASMQCARGAHPSGGTGRVLNKVPAGPLSSSACPPAARRGV